MKPPRRWLAFLLNLTFTPAGYVYVGALRSAAILVAAVLFLMLGLSIWTFHSPPGLYALPGMSGKAPGASLYALALGLAVAVHAALLAGRAAARPTGARLWIMAAAGPLLLLAAAGLLRAFSPISVYSAASSSSEPTLTEGDVIAVRGARALCGRASPNPGDLVIYRRRNDPGTRYVHRVVAVGGDTVEVRGGRLIVNGAAAELEATGRTFETEFGLDGVILRETLPDGASHEIIDLMADGEGDTLTPRKLPAGHVFIMGDNRDNALDSRFEGAIPLGDVCGVAIKVLHAEDRSRIGRRP